MRTILVFVAVTIASSTAQAQERLVESVNVIYREASDDYIFRIRFAYEPDLWTLTRRNPPSTAMFPDTHFSFELLGDPGPNVIAGISSMSVPTTGLISVYDSDSLVERVPFALNADVFETTVNRDSLGIPIENPLVNYAIWVTHENVGEYPGGNRLVLPVTLNVPEPSTPVIATGIVLLAIPLAVRRSLRRRRLSP